MKLLDAAVKSSPEETRTRILAAAREVFARKGSRGTTTREVADQANVNEATLFRHFGTKVALLQAMLDWYAGPSEGGPLSFLDEREGTLEERLQRMGHAAVDAIRKKQDLIRVSMAEEESNPDGCSLTWRGPVHAQALLAGFMRRHIAAGELRGDPEHLARLFMSLFFAYVMCPKIWQREGIEDEGAVRALIDSFLNGARAH